MGLISLLIIWGWLLATLGTWNGSMSSSIRAWSIDSILWLVVCLVGWPLIITGIITTKE